MGRTVPAFRIALESEIGSYGLYRAALKSKEARDALDDMFNQARSNCMAAGNAVRPVVFEGFFMAVAWSHEKRLSKLHQEVEILRLSLKDD